MRETWQVCLHMKPETLIKTELVVLLFMEKLTPVITQVSNPYPSPFMFCRL